jgi:hypothetical protein
MKRTNEELTTLMEGLIHEPLKVRSVTHVNFKPHPFMIGPKHVAYAAKCHGGMLGEATMRAVPCAWKHCHTEFEGHTSERVLFVELTRSATNAEVRGVLTPELGKTMELEGIEGVAFVKNAYEIVK